MKQKFWKLTAAVLLLAVAISGVTGCGGKKTAGEAALYIKDGALYYTSTAKIAPQQITNKYYQEEWPAESVLEDVWYAEPLTFLDEQGGLFYPADYGGGWSLLYQNINETEEKANLIDTGIHAQIISDDGKLVTYIKDDALYQSDRAGNKEKIHDSISEEFVCYNVDVSADGKTMYYLDDSRTLFRKAAGEAEEKIAENISEKDFRSCYYICDDFKTIYYLENGNLYKKTTGQQAEMIAEQVVEILRGYQSGTLYYLKNNEYDVCLADYVENDQPGENMELMQSLESMTVKRSDITICYYDGAKEIKLAEDTSLIDDVYGRIGGFESSLTYNGREPFNLDSVNAETPVMLYTVAQLDEIEKIKLSALNPTYIDEDGFNMLYYISRSLASTRKVNMASGGTSEPLEQLFDDIVYYVAPGGDALYYADFSRDAFGEASKRKNRTVYKRTCENGQWSELEFYDQISSRYMQTDISFLQDGTVVYYKNYDDEQDTGDLYVNQEQIGRLVKKDNVMFTKTASRILYLADWNGERQCGTLMLYENGAQTEIAKNVTGNGGFRELSDGTIAYLQNYDTDFYGGELYFYRDGTATLVDEHVSGILGDIRRSNRWMADGW